MEQLRGMASHAVMDGTTLMPSGEGVSAATVGRDPTHERIRDVLADLDIGDDVRQTVQAVCLQA
ncbi:hypothetical protein B4589_004705 [Halolamina sp. CBA1230]|uniref:hypothetical protein n=1 Tax=Halolamina sp. CBA1230 TaxID=1853690 RepID=UPI0009A21EAF|nr:hypothetical protein [Halolamina sp. CBA1230]QKY19713.1 hypothetical protein B4589_004705 [Halolamina sp. CBA1230]